jgi:acyl-coenzyme A synthetase/AMP-(fatty) acid ligase
VFRVESPLSDFLRRFFIILSKFLPLSELFVSERKSNSIVAFEQGKPIDWETFSKQVAGLCRQLKRKPRGQWLVASQSSYAFTVGLCALWQTDNVAILPPHLQSGTLSEMAGEFCGVVSDSVLSLLGVPVLSPSAVSARSWKWKQLDRQKISLKLYTSGSTGERKSVPKTLANLEEELAVQEATFGDRLGNCTILSTVSHQHIYGLLFRLLWPLCAGRAFVAETPLLWEEVLSTGRSHSAVGLVSSPAHLDYACASGKNSLFDSQVIFSSGAPLKKQTAKTIRKSWGITPIEIFGSTETGGVGWRIQNDRSDSEFWTPFSGVLVSADVRADQQLQVLSPFMIPSEGDGWRKMGDRGKVFDDGRFLTDGRVDRIVKIGGKRLSLDEMEARLNRHAWVTRTALTVFTRENSSRYYVGAVIVLNRRGKTGLLKIGRLAADKRFRADLKAHFESVALPRYFSYVDALPTNSQGKITGTALKSLFHDAASSEVEG